MTTVAIGYNKIIDAKGHYLTVELSETETVKFVKRYIDSIDKRDKSICLPLWYAEKENLI